MSTVGPLPEHHRCCVLVPRGPLRQHVFFLGAEDLLSCLRFLRQFFPQGFRPRLRRRQHGHEVDGLSSAEDSTVMSNRYSVRFPNGDAAGEGPDGLAVGFFLVVVKPATAFSRSTVTCAEKYKSPSSSRPSDTVDHVTSLFGYAGLHHIGRVSQRWRVNGVADVRQVSCVNDVAAKRYAFAHIFTPRCLPR